MDRFGPCAEPCGFTDERLGASQARDRRSGSVGTGASPCTALRVVCQPRRDRVLLCVSSAAPHVSSAPRAPFSVKMHS